MLLLRKISFSLLLGFAASLSARSQSGHFKIVYDLVSADTADHSAVLRQFNNILKAAPDAELEVVCHGPAIYMMVKQKVFFEERMAALKSTGRVSYKVCANSLRRLGVDKSELIVLAEVVPVAILEIAEKQQQGWSYIKAGH